MPSGSPSRSGRPLTTSYADLMKPDEDWRHLPNSAERRRIQNRLAQRAYRRNMRDRSKEVEKLKKQLQELQESCTGDASASSPRGQGLISGSRSPSSAGDTPITPHPADSASGQNGSPSSMYNYMQTWPQHHGPEQMNGFGGLASDENPSSSMAFNAATPYFSRMGTYDDVVPELSTANLSGRPRAFTTIAPGLHNPSQSRSHSISAAFPSNAPSPLPWSIQAAERRGTLPGLTSFGMYGGASDRTMYHPESVYSLGDSLPPSTPYATSPDSDLNSVASWSGFDKKVKIGQQPGSSSITSGSFMTNTDVGDVSSIPKSLPETTAPLLHFAVAGGSIDTLQVLLRQPNTNLNAKDSSGYTALQRAVMCGRPDMAAVLLERGASIEGENYWRASGALN